MQIKLLIACEDESLGLVLSSHFAQDAAADIAIFTTDPARLRVETAKLAPDVLLLEQSPGSDPEAVLQPLLRLRPATRVLFLCENLSHELMLALVRLGACGCLLRSDPPAIWAKAVRAVHGGDAWFGRSSLVLALRSLVGAAAVVHTRPDEGRLTAREEEVFDLIGRGLSNKEVARELTISDHTVKTHLHRIYVKLHQSGRYKALLSHAGRLSH